jgi:malonate transporter and related proteins
MYYAQLLFPDFLLILCGYLICHFTALNRTVWEQVESLVYYFLFPVLLFHAIVRSPIDLRATSGLVYAAWALAACGVAASYALRSLPTIAREDFASTAQIAFRFNSFIALTMADRLMGSQGTSLIAVIIGVCVPIFNMAAVWPMAKQSGSGFAKALVRNPLIIATLSGLVCNLLGFKMPAWLEPSVVRVGQASLALGLLAAGAGLQLGAVFNTASRIQMGLATLSIRHLVSPFIAWGLAQAFALPTAQATVLLIFSAVPTASSCYVLASKMGYDGRFAAGLVTLSTLLAALSLPFGIALAQSLHTVVP